MCTRLHAIGFSCEMDQQAARFITDTAANPRQTIAHAAGEYRIWRGRTGAEVWLHYPAKRPGRRLRLNPHDAAPPGTTRPFDPIDDLMGIGVFHAGRSAIRMRIARTLRINDTNPLEGVCVAALPSARPGEKPIAFTFELMDFAAHRRLIDVDAKVQISAVAQKVWAYPSEHAYLNATPAHRLIGRGAIVDVDSTDVPDVTLVYRPKPATLWLTTGEIRRSTRLLNSHTRRPYYLIDLATDRGAIDLVASPDIIDGDVSTGHTIQVLATLSGRIIETNP